ncbi:TIGR02300 family protein [Salipiger bermudensis]|uniref:TIGR02300 family protein n=1 Tax=Salipiger TaxID=263377 RepID=UPI001CD52F98|nr:TIGR02300 family protein [Salipiger bermudensis]MCA0964823.1 TIGR02300 family protein [Salipiger bermudensis]
MPKEEWGTKRVCPTTGKRFYDLNKDPIVSPYTGEVLELDTGKRTMLVADAADGAKRKADAENDESDDLLDDDVEVDLDDDDVLEDDDDDNVSLDDITDVASEDDES